MKKILNCFSKNNFLLHPSSSCIKEICLIGFFIFFTIFAYPQLNLAELNVVNDNYNIDNSVYADINNDGLKDLISSGIICNRYGRKRSIIAWQANLGNGNFGLRTILYNSSRQHNSLAIASGDIDNDGDNDIVFEFKGNINVIKNLNNGEFANEISYTSGNVRAMHLIDMDNDNYLDIVFQDDFERIKIKWNLKNGNFLTTYNNSINISIGAKFKINDINNDNLPDIIINNHTLFNFHLNNGNRVFSFVNKSFFPMFRSVTARLGDFNKDKLNDLVVASKDKILIYYNQGNVTTTLFDKDNYSEIYTSESSTYFQEFILNDFNNDSFLDIAFSTPKNNLIIQNQNNNDFTKHHAFKMSSIGLAAEDLNDDDLIDLINGDLIFFNQDNFDFKFKNYTNKSLHASHTLADINNDGLNDIISISDYDSGGEYQINYFINKGDSGFGNRRIIKSSSFNHHMSISALNLDPIVFDIDNDGLKDVMVFERGGFGMAENAFWVKNLGNNNFETSFQHIPNINAFDPIRNKVIPIDFDGDNDKDLLINDHYYENVNGKFKEAILLNTDNFHIPKLAVKKYNNTIDIYAAKVEIEGSKKYMSIKQLNYNQAGDLLKSKKIVYKNLDGITDFYDIRDIYKVDIDNDGWKDIVFNTYNLIGDYTYYGHDFFYSKNLGNDFFFGMKLLISNNDFFSEGRNQDFELVDIDNDGDIDIIETSNKPYVINDVVFSNIHWNESGNFEKKEVLFNYTIEDKCNQIPVRISISDLDNDGNLDLLKCNAYEYATISLKAYNTNSLSIRDNTFQSGINVYPNPINDVFFIKSINQHPIISLRLFSITGKLLIEQSEKTNLMNIKELRDGMYILKIDTDFGVFSKKIIKNSQYIEL